MPIVDPDKFESTNNALPPGSYQARILEVTQKTSKKNNEYLNWKFETVSDDPSKNKRWVYDTTMFNGFGIDKFRNYVRCAFDETYTGGPIDTELLVGCLLTIEVDKAFNEDGTESAFPKVVNFGPPEL